MYGILLNLEIEIGIQFEVDKLCGATFWSVQMFLRAIRTFIAAAGGCVRGYLTAGGLVLAMVTAVWPGKGSNVPDTFARTVMQVQVESTDRRQQCHGQENEQAILEKSFHFLYATNITDQNRISCYQIVNILKNLHIPSPQVDINE